jgi:uncharacterized Zn finger protein
MELGNFEDYIIGIIVSRGEEYFDNGCVTSLESLGNHRYAAEVEGSDTYEITVQKGILFELLVQVSEENKVLDFRIKC